MDAAIHAEWIAELRSGKHAQGHGYLKVQAGDYDYDTDVATPAENSTPELCCLGVLCEIAVRREVIAAPRYNGHEYTYRIGIGESSDTHLPEKVQEWAGLDWSPKVQVQHDGEDGGYINLVDLNDTYNYSFAQIADALEAAGPDGVLED